MSLTIINGPAKVIGQRRIDNRYSSLHFAKQPPKDQPRSPTPEDIYADPKSSDDESSTKQDEVDGRLSDGSLTAVATKKKGTARLEVNGESGGHRFPKEETAECAAAPLQNPPSHFPSTAFTSKKPSEAYIGSQSSQKRLRDETDDDMGSFGSSQSKKAKMKTYGGPSNIHKGSAVKQKTPIKAAPTKKSKEAPAYRLPNAEVAARRKSISKLGLRVWSMLTLVVNRLQAESKGSERSAYKTPSHQSSPRAQRASQRSAKSTQESSQTSSKDFKQPPRLPPQKGPQSRAIPVTCEEVAAPSVTKASAPAKKPLLVADANAFKSSDLQSAFKNVTDKLGIPEMQMNPSLSAGGDSSAPPTSLDAATTMSSPLSSLDDLPSDFSQEDIPVIRSADIPICDPILRPSTCPMCKQPVDKAYLEQHTKVGTRMTLRQQAQFCKAHKERTAESEWAERRFPNIHWDELDARIVEFHTAMDDILSRRKPSFYGNAFEDSLKSGKNKTVQESLMRGDEIEETSPGYYGGRGAKVMYGRCFLQTLTCHLTILPC